METIRFERREAPSVSKPTRLREVAAHDAELAEAIEALPPEGRALVSQIRANPPVRTVSGNRSVTGRFPSAKMGRSIQFESRHLEEAAIWTFEDDPNVLEYFDQPCHLRVTWAKATGRRQTVLYPVDFLVIRRCHDRSGIEFWLEEWKPKRELEKRAEKNPGRYQLEGAARFVDAAASQAAADLGVSFRIQTEDDVSAVAVRNAIFLYDYRWRSNDVPSELRKQVLKVVRDCSGLTLAELFERLPDADRDSIYALIAEREVWANLSEELVADPERLRIFADSMLPALARAAPKHSVNRGEVQIAKGSCITWHGENWRILFEDSAQLHLVSGEGLTIALKRSELERLLSLGQITGAASSLPSQADYIAKLSEPQREALTARLKLVAPYLHSAEKPPDRKTRKLLKEFREREAITGDGVTGFAPAFDRCGRRGRRVDPAALQIAREVIAQKLLTPELRSVRACHRLFVARCKEENVRPFTWQTFRSEVASVPHADLLQKTRGRRAAIAGATRAEPSPLPKDGDRAFERVHVDHTELDIELRDSETHGSLGRPWLSLAVDANSDRVLGHVLRFDAPSRTTLMLLIRDLVYRHHRLPETLITDHGADFTSTYFEALAAAFWVTIERRPVGAAKYGGPVERPFGSLDTNVVHTMRGNTQASKAPRVATRDVHPKVRAIWNLAALNDVLEEYLYVEYDQFPDATLGLSPRQRFEKSVAATGLRPNRYIAYDRGFLIATSLTTSKGTAKVAPQGIKVNSFRYWHPEFSRLVGRHIDVRYDPLDISVVYARVGGSWLDCHSQSLHASLAGRSVKEVRVASEELRARLRRRSVAEVDMAARLDSRIARTEHDLLESRRAAEQDALLEQRRGRPREVASRSAPLFVQVREDELLELEDEHA